MLEVFFCKSAICYYIIGLFSGYHQKIGRQMSYQNSNGNIYNLLFNISTVAGTIFIAYHSYKTQWWAFLGLLLLNILFYVIIDLLIAQLSIYPPVIRGKIAFLGKFLIIPLIVLMLFLEFSGGK